MPPNDKSFITVFEDYKLYAEKRHKKQGYITTIQDFNNHILPYFKNRTIQSLTKIDIIDWQDKILEHNFSNKYNAKLYYDFSVFIKYCIAYSYLDTNIVLEAGKFNKKVEIKEHVTYTLRQFRKYRRYLKDYILKQYFNCMYFYGTRPSETMAFRFCDIDKNYLFVRHNLRRKGDRCLDTPKNQSSVRKLKINWLMRLRIWRLKKLYTKRYGVFKPEYFIFGGEKPLAPTTIDRYKTIACKKAKLKHITQHEFRHSYATRMIHKGIPIDYVSKRMGHSQISTTVDVYLHQEKSTYNKCTFQ